jgi:hypothetical protein
VISPIEALPGFYLASGFSGHGFGIGPGAGRLIADMVFGDNPIVDPGPFRFERLARRSKRVAAGAVSREMEASLRLSGWRQRRGDAVGDSESDWSWTVARKRRSAQTRTLAEGRSSLIRIAADPD